MLRRGLIGGAVIVMTVAAAVVISYATAGPSACTGAGCDDGVGVLFWEAAQPDEEAVFVRFCALGRCDQGRVGRDFIVDLPCPGLDGEGTVTVTGRVIGEGGEVKSTASKEIKITRFEPNGSECEPTCWGGQAAFSARKGRFVPWQQVRDALARRHKHA
jgi:hypothetical protein